MLGFLSVGLDLVPSLLQLQHDLHCCRQNMLCQSTDEAFKRKHCPVCRSIAYGAQTHTNFAKFGELNCSITNMYISFLYLPDMLFVHGVPLICFNVVFSLISATVTVA